MSIKRVIIAGAGSGVGKTTIATGLMSRLSKKMRVQGFKVGPDFIDPMFHTAATGRSSRNLDSFFMDPGTLKNLFGWSTADADIAIVEGVRGLYDGLTATGDTGSTAEIAKFLGAPVVLVVNARSLAKSAAAHVLGFKMLDPEVKIAGVILNQVSGPRHRQKAVEAVESLTGTEVIGVIERRNERMPERHLGLVTVPEKDDIRSVLEQTEEMVVDVDLDRLLAIAEDVEDVHFPDHSPFPSLMKGGPRFAVPKDKVFSFYYPENLEAIEAAGGSIVHFSPIDGDPLPDADAVYMGGGYPEVFMDRLAENTDFLEGISQFSKDGKFVYGECGGMMVMCDAIRANGSERKMAGIIPSVSELTKERQGLAYVEATGTKMNFLFPGKRIRAHEFHYSRLTPIPQLPYGYEIGRGTGIGDKKDGVIIGRTMGTYMHQHALSNKDWGPAFVRAASEK